MANRFFVGMGGGAPEPAWLCRVEPFLSAAMQELRLDGEALSVVFCGDDFIRSLNRRYRGIDAPTDVLSFEDGAEEYEEDGTALKSMGDILISLDTLPGNAAYFGVDADEELKRLLVHGILHLNGMDHGEEHVEPGTAPVCAMLCLQEVTLQKLNDYTIIWNK